MGRDGANQIRLTAVAGADRHPDWSPWQSHIADLGSAAQRVAER
jgi:hypothetical protein